MRSLSSSLSAAGAAGASSGATCSGATCSVDPSVPAFVSSPRSASRTPGEASPWGERSAEVGRNVLDASRIASRATVRRWPRPCGPAGARSSSESESSSPPCWLETLSLLLPPELPPDDLPPRLLAAALAAALAPRSRCRSSERVASSMAPASWLTTALAARPIRLATFLAAISNCERRPCWPDARRLLALATTFLVAFLAHSRLAGLLRGLLGGLLARPCRLGRGLLGRGLRLGGGLLGRRLGLGRRLLHGGLPLGGGLLGRPFLEAVFFGRGLLGRAPFWGLEVFFAEVVRFEVDLEVAIASPC